MAVVVSRQYYWTLPRNPLWMPNLQSEEEPQHRVREYPHDPVHPLPQELVESHYLLFKPPTPGTAAIVRESPPPSSLPCPFALTSFRVRASAQGRVYGRYNISLKHSQSPLGTPLSPEANYS